MIPRVHLLHRHLSHGVVPMLLSFWSLPGWVSTQPKVSVSQTLILTAEVEHGYGLFSRRLLHSVIFTNIR